MSQPEASRPRASWDEYFMNIAQVVASFEGHTCVFRGDRDVIPSATYSIRQAEASA